MVNKYDDMIFLYPAERARTPEGEHEGETVKVKDRECRERNCSSPAVCVLFMSVTYSTYRHPNCGEMLLCLPYDCLQVVFRLIFAENRFL